MNDQYLMHCLACDDFVFLASARAFCRCTRSSGRFEDGAVLVGPARVLNLDGTSRQIHVRRPSAAVGT